MKEFLSIGEISALFGLNVQTLYYYDSIGLFKPQKRDHTNDRRKYAFEQIYELATICYMRKIGCPLEEIRDSRQTQCVDTALEQLRKRSLALHRQWEELLKIDEAIQRKISFIEKERGALHQGEVCIRTYGTRRYLPIGREELLYRDNSFYFYPTIAFYEGAEKYFGAYLFPDDAVYDEAIPAAQVMEIEAGDYLCGCHVGAYETICESIKTLRSSRPDLMLDNTAINFNLLDQFVEHDSADYMTQIQLRIIP